MRSERLGFRDAVLGNYQRLFVSYPHLPGKLTRLRSGLVCEASLAQLAFRMNLGQYCGWEKAKRRGQSEPPALLADALLCSALF